MKQTLVLFAATLLLGGCSPKVITRIEKSYPQRVAEEEVEVYESKANVPKPSERIGSVRVLDSGFSVKCKYGQVIALAKRETAKNGGNAFAITWDKPPSIWGSTCHQIEGDMLWVYNDSVERKPSVPASVTEEEQPKETAKFRHNTFYANFGYSFTTRRIYAPAEATGHPKQGMDWQVGYDWVSRKGLGAGLMYSGYRSSYIYDGVKNNVGMTYIAPQFVIKQIFGRWTMEEKIGVGYIRYKTSAKGSSDTSSGGGCNFLFGVGYLLTETVGIGTNLGYIGGSLPDEAYAGSGNSSPTMWRFNFDIGIRFNF